jgi:amidase
LPKRGDREPKVLARESGNAIYSFSAANIARMKASPGETVIFETLDCFGGQIRSADDKFEKVGWDKINPATGPLYIEGARKGDTLCVEILDIQVDSPGIMVAVPGLGAAPDRIRESVTIIVPIKNGLAHLPQDVILEIRPMIGVIGTAPAEGAVPCGTPGPHGGNMDTNVIAEGSMVFLPVCVDGALLAMGDLHALMGDGEVLVCGVEVSGKVTVRVRLLRGHSLPCPVVETESAYYAVWSAETLDAAAQGALYRSLELLQTGVGYSAEDSLALLSVRGNLQVSQVVDPLKTARMEIPKSILKGRNLIPAQA